MNLLKAEETIKSLNKDEVKAYSEYWESISPKTKEEVFNRWLFAQLSVHTSWSMNVSSYLLLKRNFDNWIDDRQELSRLLIESRVGLHTTREKGIWYTSQTIFKNETILKEDGETWVACRDRLMSQVYGLGFAKTAFALELCFPLLNDSVCLDTHMLQLYGYEPKDVAKANKGKVYKQIEQHWSDTCKNEDIPPYIARCLFWDKKQNHNNSKYWSYVFES